MPLAKSFAILIFKVIEVKVTFSSLLFLVPVALMCLVGSGVASSWRRGGLGFQTITEGKTHVQ